MLLQYGFPRTVQKVAYTGTAGTISNAVGAQTRVVRVTTTTAAYIAHGASPTATANDHYLPADTPWEFNINPGDKVSAVQVSSGGTLFVTEVTNVG